MPWELLRESPAAANRTVLVPLSCERKQKQQQQIMNMLSSLMIWWSRFLSLIINRCHFRGHFCAFIHGSRGNEEEKVRLRMRCDKDLWGPLIPGSYIWILLCCVQNKEIEAIITGFGKQYFFTIFWYVIDKIDQLTVVCKSYMMDF